MAFDVVSPLNTSRADDFDFDSFHANLAAAGYSLHTPSTAAVNRVRQLVLLEGRDDKNRLQPLLGTAELARDVNGVLIQWPRNAMYAAAGLWGPMQGAIGWHSPTTEVPGLGDVEDWALWNLTPDAHPIHVHMVHFTLIHRKRIKYDSNADDEGLIPVGSSPAGDGTYLIRRPVHL